MREAKLSRRESLPQDQCNLTQVIALYHRQCASVSVYSTSDRIPLHFLFIQGTISPTIERLTGYGEIMEAQPKEIRRYITPDGRIPFLEWYYSLRDSKAKFKIDARLE